MIVKIVMNEGRYAPRLFCDLCKNEVKAGQNAEYLIPDLKEEGETGETIVGHTVCTKGYEKTLRIKERASLGNMPLDALFIYLMNNLEIDHDKTQLSVQRMAMLG